ncbi:MAG: type II toxin-antitoxin system RelE/ParE family toxin [Rhizobiaceae bacterium]|nr:type II toxin-antitoxin system RelE/ParE family toxin [Rhizobiaceae bacterium]
MAWKIEIQENALKQLSKLGKQDAKRILGFLKERLGTHDDPRKIGSALQGSRLGNFWRYRVGDYRIICDLQDEKLIVLVIEIGHRREVYR